jgi:hypothetical protein
LLEFASEHRIVLSGHIQALLGISADAAATRLRSLARGGFLSREAVFDCQPPCYRITRKGLATVGSSLPPPRVDLRSYRHDVGLAWLSLAAQGGAFGAPDRVVSERQMRSLDATEEHSARALGGATEPFAVRLGGVGAGGRERLHYPDLLLVAPGGRRVAIELELTSKSRVRRERILAGYGADRRIEAVLYLVDSGAVANAVRESAARLRISERVHVQGVQWGRDSRGRGAARTRAAERRAELAR